MVDVQDDSRHLHLCSLPYQAEEIIADGVNNPKTRMSMKTIQHNLKNRLSGDL
jgi:hypothetical protein